jgi:hypothetical protein
MSISAALNEPRLRLVDMLERKGVKLGDDLWQIRADAVATRTCVFCRSKEECDAWLASGRTEGFEAFCPNAGYIAARGSR